VVGAVGTRVVSRVADQALGLAALSRVYAASQRRAVAAPGVPFCEHVLAELQIEESLNGAELERLPRSGAAVVVANHPLGGADGLLLLALLLRARPDVRLLANSWLLRVAELRPHLIGVDVFGGGGWGNSRAARAARAWLAQGGCIATFPAGEVSRFRPLDGRVADGQWSASFVRLARRARCPVVPVCFDERNSLVFGLAGLVHSGLATTLLARELLRRRRGRVRVRIGHAIPAGTLQRLGDREATEVVRGSVYVLSEGKPGGVRGGASGEARADAAIASPANPTSIRSEIDALPSERTLGRIGSLRVMVADRREVPTVIEEIGRLRELTYRLVGEATGAARDLDRFDDTYLHLFTYDDDAGLLVGAYRMGPTDRIMPGAGVKGLYTSTLFEYEPTQLARLCPGIELGRSFVRPEYQRHPAALLLLWQGIVRYVGQRPHYRYLFGTVSISDTYPSVTRDFLVRFVTLTFGGEDWARLASPTMPPKSRRGPGRDVAEAMTAGCDLDDAERLVSSADPSGRGLPTLLRLYLKLGARVVGFNVDPSFGNALDGLIVVDLTNAPRRQLRRYMGEALCEAYLRYHARD
jgi:putative hemolysin